MIFVAYRRINGPVGNDGRRRESDGDSSLSSGKSTFGDEDADDECLDSPSVAIDRRGGGAASPYSRFQWA